MSKKTLKKLTHAEERLNDFISIPSFIHPLQPSGN
jgi:hypothetical protein